MDYIHILFLLFPWNHRFNYTIKYDIIKYGSEDMKSIFSITRKKLEEYLDDSPKSESNISFI